MDSDSEIARAKWLLLFGAIFLVSCFVCYSEFVYVIRAHDAQATVTDAYMVDKRGRFGIVTGKKLVVDYTFSEVDGSRRTGHDEVSSSWEVPTDGTITVRYTAGKDGRSRWSGHVNWVGLAFFAVTTSILIFSAIRLWQKAAEATSGKPKRRV
jgi:hypothetical protein